MAFSRGVYHGLYGVLFDHPDFQRLTAAARLTLLTARQCTQAGPGAIFRYYPEVLARQTGLDARKLASALRELAEQPSIAESWIVLDRVVIWIRNGLRHDPHMRLADPKHRKAVEKSLAGLPRSQVVINFCEYYQFSRPYEGPSESHPELALLVPSTEYLVPRVSLRDTSRVPRKGLRSPIVGPTEATPLPPWALAPEIRDQLTRTRFAPLATDERFWRSQFRSRNGLDFTREILKADAWCASNPDRAPKTNVRRFLNSWFERAQGDA